MFFFVCVCFQAKRSSLMRTVTHLCIETHICISTGVRGSLLFLLHTFPMAWLVILNSEFSHPIYMSRYILEGRNLTYFHNTFFLILANLFTKENFLPPILKGSVVWVSKPLLLVFDCFPCTRILLSAGTTTQIRWHMPTGLAMFSAENIAQQAHDIVSTSMCPLGVVYEYTFMISSRT